jgi:hypothetical protein
MAGEGLPLRYFVTQAGVLEALAKSTQTARVLAFNRKTLQYKLQCEQPLNSRLFLEDFFLSYVAVFQTP